MRRVTQVDIARATDPSGRVAAVAELLSQSNEILLDMPWVEGNLTTGHKGSIRTGLPEPIWRKLYQGVPPTKSLRATVEDSCGMLEDRSEVDTDAISLNGNTSEFRLSEGYAFIEAMNQTMAETLIYGNTVANPERFTGLAPRFNTIANAENGQNVIDGGGTGIVIATRQHLDQLEELLAARGLPGADELALLGDRRHDEVPPHPECPRAPGDIVDVHVGHGRRHLLQYKRSHRCTTTRAASVFNHRTRNHVISQLSSLVAVW